MKKIAIKYDEKGISLKSTECVAEALHILSLIIVDTSIKCGITKKEMLEAMKSYYEDAMKNEANK